MNVTFTNGTNSYTVNKEGTTTRYKRNSLFTIQESTDANVLHIVDKFQANKIIFSLDVSVDTINVDGTTSWADAATLDAALEPLFFLVSSGSGGGGVPVDTTHIESITAPGDWTLDGGSGRYYVDATHNLGTRDLLIEAYDTSTNDTYVFDDYERTSINVVRIWSTVNTISADVVISTGGVGFMATEFVVESEQTVDFSPSSKGGSLYPVNSATDVTATIDEGACEIGESIYFRQEGVGQVVLAAGTATIPLDPYASLKSRGQYATIGVMRISTSVYEVLGKTE